jgi:hypothetical protein
LLEKQWGWWYLHELHKWAVSAACCPWLIFKITNLFRFCWFDYQGCQPPCNSVSYQKFFYLIPFLLYLAIVVFLCLQSKHVMMQAITKCNQNVATSDLGPLHQALPLNLTNKPCKMGLTPIAQGENWCCVVI